MLENGVSEGVANHGYTIYLLILWFTASYYGSARVWLQFQYHNQYSTVTQALVLAPEIISLTKRDETVTENFYCLLSLVLVSHATSPPI